MEDKINSRANESLTSGALFLMTMLIGLVITIIYIKH